MGQMNFDPDTPRGQPSEHPRPLPPPILNYATPQPSAGAGPSGKFLTGFLLELAAIIVAGIIAVLWAANGEVVLAWVTLIGIPMGALALGAGHQRQYQDRLLSGMIAGLLAIGLTVGLAFGLCVAVISSL